MQKTILIVGRLWFLATALVLVLVLFVGELLVISSKKPKTKLMIKNEPSIGVLLASSQAQNDSADLGGEIRSSVVGDDARPLLIKRYLEKYKSPLVPYSDLIFKLSQTYGFEYYWIVAIAQQESNLCKKIPENSFNCWGYGINSAGTLRFESYEVALKSYAEYLKRQYFDKGLNTPELIMKKYCPYSNGSWAYGVRQFIGELEGGNF